MSLLQPKRWKYRKQMRWKNKWVSNRWNYIAFGEFWMKALDNWYLTNRQIESARKVITRYVRKVWKMWIRVFPDVPYTKKGLEMPMGKGKGDVETYRAKVKRGRILFEITWIRKDKAEEVMTKAWNKLPFKIRMVEKGDIK